ncbi:hypothetical protein ACSBR2_038036 [Camellia fascicularis]
MLRSDATSVTDVINQSYEGSDACLRTNYYGAKQVTEELIPLLQLSNSTRIVNVFSTLGQLKFISNEKAKKELNDIDGLTLEKVDDVIERFLEDLKEDLLETKGWPIRLSAYKVSKAALNAYTRVLAKKYRNIVINAPKHRRHGSMACARPGLRPGQHGSLECPWPRLWPNSLACVWLVPQPWRHGVHYKS